MIKEQRKTRSQAAGRHQNYLQLILVFGAFFLMVLAGYLFVRNILRNRLMESSGRALSSAEAQIRSAFAEVDITLLNMYHTVQDMIGKEESQEEILEYLTATTTWIGRHEGIFRLTAVYGYIRGELMDSVGLNPDESYIPQTRPWYQTGMRSGGTVAYTAPYIDVLTGEMVISAVRTVDNKAGGIDGIIAVDIIIKRLNEYLQGLKITEDGYGMIISQNMVVATHPQEELQGRHVEELGPGYEDISWRLRIGESISAEQIRDSDGREVLVFFSPLFNGWYVGLVTPRSTFYRDLRNIGIALASLGFILAFAVSMVLLRLNRARIRSDEESKSKSSFLARMSHDIRTPMNAIIGMGELALQAETMPKMAEYVAEIKQAGLNLLALINGILDFSKIEAGNLQIINVPYELSSLLNDVINVSRVRISKKPILFTVFVDASIPGRLSGDEMRIRQILLNLLSNAAKYTSEGSISLKVGAEPGDKQNLILVLEISDSGIGIKAEDLPGLFDNFIRLDLEKNRNIEGTGLGLAITRSLCQAMDGDITISSEYGKGSVFTARISQTIVSGVPLAQVKEPQDKGVLLFDHRPLCADSVSRTLENLGVPVKTVRNSGDFLMKLESENWPFAFVSAPLCAGTASSIIKSRNLQTHLALLADLGVTAADIPSITMPAYAIPIANVLNGKANGNRWEKVRVKFTAPHAKALIVDDIITNLKVAEGLMLPYHMEVYLCTAGRKAVEMVKRYEYDIVFMDHMMPEMDGIEAAAAIRTWEAEQENSRRPVPLVALTANAISGMKEMFLEKGFNDYLSKPIEIAKLNELLEKWIPEDKRENIKTKKDGNRQPQKDEIGSGPVFTVIPGVDMEKGIAMTGGTLDGYWQVLSVLCKDAQERFPLLQTLPEERNLPLFTTQVHALKSALATTGAEELSAEAARLEAAGKAGDLVLIGKNLSGFAERLEALVRNIRTALNTSGGVAGGLPRTGGSGGLDGKAGKAGARGVVPPPDSVLLGELLEALRSQKADSIDRLMETLSRQAPDAETRETVQQISDAVLMADFEQAAALVDSLRETREN